MLIVEIGVGIAVSSKKSEFREILETKLRDSMSRLDKVGQV